MSSVQVVVTWSILVPCWCSIARNLADLSIILVVIKNHRMAIKDCSARAWVGAKNCSLTAKLGVVLKNLSLMAKCHLRNVTHHLRNKEDMIIYFKKMGLVLWC